MTENDGVTFKPEGAELTPEEKKEKALAMIDMPLEDIIKAHREENRKKRGGQPRKQNSNPRNLIPDRYIELHLSDRQIRSYLQFTDIDTSGYDVKLRLKLTKAKKFQ